ncbi:MAG: glycosyltransferase, partial [bacterium]|nr:glycosyltransferase [bacterium]
MTWRLTVRNAAPPRSGLKVAVLIPTLDEEAVMLRQTLLAAMKMDYPHETWLLDDGNRPEMRRLAEELGCNYVARAKNTQAKAGSLNNALRYVDAEYVAIFDADHVPSRRFLTRTLGYFADEHVAFVQTPQDFYNLDSYQHRWDLSERAIWTEQALFFR